MTSSSSAIEGSPSFSVVVPFFNEEVAIPALVVEILEVMDGIGDSYECLCVDDGSSDATAEILRSFAERSSSPALG